MTDRRRAAARALVVATAIAVLLVISRRFDTLSNGLRGQYFPNSDWSGAPAKTVVDAAPSAASLLQAMSDDGAPEQFSVAWTGYLIAPWDGAYTFATTSDDGSAVYVDGDLLVDNDGDHRSRTKTGPTVRLSRGPHAIFIKYFQSGGAVEFEWLWQRGAGPFDPVPDWALRPRRIEFARFAVDRTLELLGSVAPWAWATTVVATVVFAFRPEIDAAASRSAAMRAQLIEEGSWTPLVAIVIASTVLNITGLWWGLPHGVWAGDELIPSVVVGGWPQYFSHGWSDKYPPLHFYVLTLAYTPIVAAQQIARIDPVVVHTLLMVAARTVSVVMAAGTLVVVFFIGRMVFGATAACYAAALTALSAPFVYYAKAANVDVPYLFWFAISLLFYVRILQGGAKRDFIGWGVAAALAVGTKDQAYGLYVLMPLVVIVERRRRQQPVSSPLVAAAAASALTFAIVHNLAFNASGFAAHIRTIAGPGVQIYRAYPATASGQLALLAATLRMVPLSLGWPATIVCVAGVVFALSSASTRRPAVWLLLPTFSYHVTFVAVVLYNYDRFLLPVFLILSIFGGLALARLTAAPWPRWARAALVAAVLGYTLLFSATVDALMLVDSRYTAERWLAEHVGEDDMVGVTSIATYMPRMTAFNAIDVYDDTTLADLRPRWVVLNADYTLTEPGSTPLGRAIAALRSGRDGYRLAARFRSPNPLHWLPGGHADLVGERRSRDVISFLRNINPTIEIYERTNP